MAESPRHAAGGTEATRGRLLGAVPPDERFSVSLFLRLPSRAAGRAAEIARLWPWQRPRLTDAEFAAVYGADQQDVDRVVEFAKAAEFEVEEASAQHCTVRIAGSAAQFTEVFATSLQSYEYRGGTFHAPAGAVKVPAEIAELIRGVLGLDNRPIASPGSGGVGTGTSFLTALNVADVYDFPSTVDGTGQTVAIMNFVDDGFNSGYQKGDLDAYFNGLNLSTPTPVDFPVDGVMNSPSLAAPPQGEKDYDVEVTSAIELVGSFAPGATLCRLLCTQYGRWVD